METHVMQQYSALVLNQAKREISLLQSIQSMVEEEYELVRIHSHVARMHRRVSV